MKCKPSLYVRHRKEDVGGEPLKANISIGLKFEVWPGIYIFCPFTFLALQFSYASAVAIYPSSQGEESKNSLLPLPKITAHFFPTLPPPPPPHFFEVMVPCTQQIQCKNKRKSVLKVILWIRSSKLLWDHINTTEESAYCKAALASRGFTTSM